MMLPFALPLAFVAFTAVPLLVGIYWLRNRFRRHPVSSLILWMSQRQAREGGLRIRRIRTPLLFFLELLAITLVVIAAAGPMVHTERVARPLVVVLDDSFSMLAGGTDSPRNLAVAAITKELRRRPHYSVRFLLAGQSPEVLGEPVRTADEAAALLSDWQCHSALDCLNEALTFAAELGGSRARILVVTDHAPIADVGEKRVKWWAFGAPRSNVAFVNAARTTLEAQERCLLEIANLSSHPARTTLTIEGAAAASFSGKTALDLKAHETRRILFEFDKRASALRARVGDDALDVDNNVVLLPQQHRPVRVQLRVAEASLRSTVEAAIAAAEQTVTVTARPELVVTDRSDFEPPAPEAWLLQLFAEEEAEAYAGPFVLDRKHPLTEGLSLEGVVWGAGKTGELVGLPVISAGNTPLLTDAQSVTGRHHLRMRLRPDLSTLQDTPNWPILMWNLVQWRASEAPGLRRANLRLGMDALATLDPDTTSVRVVNPDGEIRDLPARGKRLAIRADDVGIYEVRWGSSTYAFASNAVTREESDLTHCASVRRGKWGREGALRREYKSIVWVFLLLALGTLAAHSAFAAPRA